MIFLADYGLFLAKSLTLLVVVLLGIVGIMAITRKPRSKIQVHSLNEQFDDLQAEMKSVIKHEKTKKLSRQDKKANEKRPTLYVIDFDGDIKATGAHALKEAVSAVLLVATPKDEVVVRIDSPGGSVNGYGLCASQLQRIRDKGIYLTACVDKVAASGGYLMACVANQIIAAPFSIVGSIGVVAQMPNFHRLLKQNQIDVELYTAGEYKRTVTVFGENTDKGREKFQEDLEHIHHAFKEYVLKNRPQLDIERVSTGEHWLAMEAYDYRLVDVIQTSDDYLASKSQAFNLFQIKAAQKQTVMQKLLKPATQLLSPF